MTEPPAPLPPDSSDDRLARIEATLAALAAAGPAPAGYAPRTNSLAAVNAAVQMAQVAGYLPGGEKVRKGWRKWPIIREFFMVFRLYFDRRYSPTRSAQLGVPLIVLLLVLNCLFFTFVFTFPVVSHILEYLVVMLLAVFLYLILAGELVRYEQVLDYLARSGRG